MRYLINENIEFNRKIHILDETGDDLGAICGFLQADSIEKYWTILDKKPDGQWCPTCKRGQFFEKAESAAEENTDGKPKTWIELNPPTPREPYRKLSDSTQEQLDALTDVDLFKIFGDEFSVRMFRKGNGVYRQIVAEHLTKIA